MIEKAFKKIKEVEEFISNGSTKQMGSWGLSLDKNYFVYVNGIYEGNILKLSITFSDVEDVKNPSNNIYIFYYNKKIKLENYKKYFNEF